MNEYKEDPKYKGHFIKCFNCYVFSNFVSTLNNNLSLCFLWDSFLKVFMKMFRFAFFFERDGLFLCLFLNEIVWNILNLLLVYIYTES